MMMLELRVLIMRLFVMWFMIGLKSDELIEKYMGIIFCLWFIKFFCVYFNLVKRMFGILFFFVMNN